MERKFNPSWHKKTLVKEISSIFLKSRYEFYLIGGAVRSLLMRRDPYDLDFTTNATPTQVMKLFSKSVPTGIKHGTVTAIWKKDHVEITTFRHEGIYSDSRRPDEVLYVSSLKRDLSRRDFTMNALAYDALRETLYDYFGGEKDIQNKIIRAIGKPEKRFSEDALRILRACRFSSELGFKIENYTLNAMKKLSKNLKKLSAERIYSEFIRTLLGNFPIYGLKLLEEIGFFSLYFKNPIQTKFWEKLSLLKGGENKLLGRLILFSLSIPTEERMSFFKALKFPNNQRDIVIHLSTLIEEQKLTPKEETARFFINKLKREHLAIYLNVQRTLSTKKDFQNWKNLLEKNSYCPLFINELAISGYDLLEKGKTGREVGILLKKALDLVLKKPYLNEKDLLLDILDL